MRSLIPVKVRFFELDPYGHVNHAVYVQYFEVGRIELLEMAGFSMMGLQDEGIRMVVTELESRFLRPAVAGDDLQVETEVAEIHRASLRFFQRIVRRDEVVAIQRTTAATIDRRDRPTRIPPALVAALTVAGPDA